MHSACETQGLVPPHFPAAGSGGLQCPILVTPKYFSPSATNSMSSCPTSVNGVTDGNRPKLGVVLQDTIEVNSKYQHFVLT